jgi:hypothetical protein
MVRVRILGKCLTKRFECQPDDTEPPTEVIETRDKKLREAFGEFARI